MSTLKFSKMHGLGNDFVVIDAREQPVDLNAAQLQFIADRHRGVGCDQILMVEHSDHDKADFRYRIFNADGGEVSQCGNGARCFARYVYDRGHTEKTVIGVETASGLIFPELQDSGEVRVNMGHPRFAPEQIPFKVAEEATTYMLEVRDGERVEIAALSMGNPHAVMLVDNVDTAPVAELGPLMEQHQQFPERANAGFMQIVSPSHIRLRVYERGVGETQACGTGACAAVVSGIRRGMLASDVTVSLQGGDLHISWPNQESPVMMTGDATHVFDGEIAWSTLNNL